MERNEETLPDTAAATERAVAEVTAAAGAAGAAAMAGSAGSVTAAAGGAGAAGNAAGQIAAPDAATDAAETAFALPARCGLGIDVVEVERIRGVMERTPSFAERVFTDGERAYCLGRPIPEMHFAARFAAKEATLKALGIGLFDGVALRDVEVVRGKRGIPELVLHRRAAEVARERGVRDFPLSLSHTHAEAVACALALTDAVVPEPQEERQTAADVLKEGFREARGWLDELG